jgi:hypothetical protein
VASSVFGDKATAPDEVGLAAALGPAHTRWTATVGALGQRFQPLQASWSYGGKAYGWSLRCSHRGRPIVYLTPFESGFRASLALPERAMAAALDAGLPAHVRDLVSGAATYPEGRAVRLPITSDDDIASLMILVQVRMAS